MPLKILYEDATLLVLDKPAGLPIEKAQVLLEQRPSQKELGAERRCGIVHRLDKDTSGVLLVAKTKELFSFLQQQFKERRVEKKYICLVVGNVKEDKGIIETLLGRSPQDRRKQKAYLPEHAQTKNGREAVTLYRVLKRFPQYTLLEITPKTGRKHQIRAHMVWKSHPIAGDKLYGFKNQPIPEGLNRQFLHASYLKIPLPNGITKEFSSELPKDLQEVLQRIESQ
ncbi:MAG: RluA family pseudouridine synthase [Candidatus Wildermuthbacteria bacterium]|nr:RluA family pseudouridine synthase [Candidatus Wildermuthbacteria bacterium]